MKLLDNGFRIMLYRNALNTYTASAFREGMTAEITDDRTPSKALHRLTEKIYGNIVKQGE